MDIACARFMLRQAGMSFLIITLHSAALGVIKYLHMYVSHQNGPWCRTVPTYQLRKSVYYKVIRLVSSV